MQGLGPNLQLLHSVRVLLFRLMSSTNGKKHFIFLVDTAYLTVFSMFLLTKVTVLDTFAGTSLQLRGNCSSHLAQPQKSDSALARHSGHVPLEITRMNGIPHKYLHLFC